MNQLQPEAAPAVAESFAPTADDIAQLVASEYGVSIEQAMIWCFNVFDCGDDQ